LIDQERVTIEGSRMNRISFATMAAVVLAATVIAACRPAAVPPPPPAPAPAVAPAAAEAPVVRRDSTMIVDPAMACVVQGGRIFEVEVQYRSATSDSLVNGRPFHEVYPITSEHAASARWYANNEPILFAGHRYVKYGLPRVLGQADVVLVGNVQGVSAFAQPLAPGTIADVIYLAVDVGCMFQAYQTAEAGAAVRG
jgi:hypothetical protein